MRKFKVGDRVTVKVVRGDDYDVRDGLIGTITDLGISIAEVKLGSGKCIYPYLDNLVFFRSCPMEAGHGVI